MAVGKMPFATLGKLGLGLGLGFFQTLMLISEEIATTLDFSPDFKFTV